MSGLGGDGERRGIRRRRPDEQLGERPAAPLQLAGALGLLARKALGGLGGELVHVGEDRLGQQYERLRRQPGRQSERGEPTPGHAGAGAKGREQRVERAARPQFAAAEVGGHGSAREAAARGELGELRQGALHAAQHRAGAERERARVFGHVSRDRSDDLLGQRRKMRRKDVDLARKRGKLYVRHKFSSYRAHTPTRIRALCCISFRFYVARRE